MFKVIQKIPSLKNSYYYFFSAQPSVQKLNYQKQLTPKDFSRIDIRIGQIIQSQLHPQLSSHYCKKIRIQINPNTIIKVASGSRNHIDQQHLHGKVAVMVNLNHGELLGCKNQGNVLYALDANKTIADMIVPDGQIGQRIFLQHLQYLFPGGKISQCTIDPDGKFLQKIFHDFKTDKQGYLIWKDRKLMTKNGFLKSSLKNSIVL